MILYSRAQRIFDSYVAAKANLLPADFIGSGVLPTAWYDAELAELDADDQSWRAREPHIPPIMFEAPLTGTIGKPIPPGTGQVWNIPAINALPTTNPDPSRTIIVSPAQFQMLQDKLRLMGFNPTGLNSNPARTTLMGIDVIVSNSIEPGQAAILPSPVPSGMLTPEHIAAAKAYLSSAGVPTGPSRCHYHSMSGLQCRDVEGHSGPHGT